MTGIDFPRGATVEWETLRNGKTYYGGPCTVYINGVLGCGSTPQEAATRALGHLHYHRDPDEWLAARRKRRAAR